MSLNSQKQIEWFFIRFDSLLENSFTIFSTKAYQTSGNGPLKSLRMRTGWSSDAHWRLVKNWITAFRSPTSCSCLSTQSLKHFGISNTFRSSILTRLFAQRNSNSKRNGSSSQTFRTVLALNEYRSIWRETRCLSLKRNSKFEGL